MHLMSKQTQQIYVMTVLFVAQTMICLVTNGSDSTMLRFRENRMTSISNQSKFNQKSVCLSCRVTV